ncbi:MAG: hypothetical protein AAF434_01580 [Pseudomonadota bacterium]
MPAISRGDHEAFECLYKAHIKVSERKLPVEFSLGNLFAAVWLWGIAKNMQLPNHGSYKSEFQAFWLLLTNPWPMDSFAKAGLSLKPRKTTGAKETHIYVLSNT